MSPPPAKMNIFVKCHFRPVEVSVWVARPEQTISCLHMRNEWTQKKSKKAQKHWNHGLIITYKLYYTGGSFSAKVIHSIKWNTLKEIMIIYSASYYSWELHMITLIDFGPSIGQWSAVRNIATEYFFKLMISKTEYQTATSGPKILVIWQFPSL